MKFRIYITRTPIKSRISIFEKIINLTFNAPIKFRISIFEKTIILIFLILLINLLLTIKIFFFEQFEYFNKLFEKLSINKIVFESRATCFV